MSDFVLDAWSPPGTIGESAELLLELTDRKKAHAEFASQDLHQRIVMLEQHIIDQLSDAGLDSVKACGHTFYRQTMTDVSWAGDDKGMKDFNKNSLLAYLSEMKDGGEQSDEVQAFVDLLKTTVDVRSIGTLIREFEEDGMVVPESIMEHLQVKQRVTVGKRKSG